MWMRHFGRSLASPQEFVGPRVLKNGLPKGCLCSQIVCVKTVTYPIRIEKRDYEMLVAEANRRRKSLADLFRDLITYGVPALPPIPETYEALHEVWDNLGPPPEILHDKLPRGR